VAQPFLLKAEVDSVMRKHIPDYLLITDDGPVVVDRTTEYSLSFSGHRFDPGRLWKRTQTFL
jgi:hypothetical protein